MGLPEPSNRPPPQLQPSLTNMTTKLEEVIQQLVQVSISNPKSTKASLRNLDIQIGQLANKLEEKPKKNFGINTEVNPKEQCKAIVTRSGKVLMERDALKNECEKEKGETSGEKSKNNETVEGEDENRVERKNNEKKEIVKPLPYAKTHSR